MQIHFGNSENQTRWAWTNGLQALGQREIAVTISWPEHDSRDALIARLLHFLEHYISNQPKRILPGQTLRYGWSMLRFVNDEHNLSGAGTDVLSIEEEQPSSSNDSPSYTPGVVRTLTLLQLQNDVLRRNGIAGDAIYPYPSQIAVVCKRMNPKTIQLLRPLRAHRAWKPNTRESGWFMGCCDHNHNHDNPDELNAAHLSHLVEIFPALFPYLAMPVDTMLIFEENQAVIFRPGEQGGQPDPAGLLSSLP